MALLQKRLLSHLRQLGHRPAVRTGLSEIQSKPAENYFVLANGHGVINDYMSERGSPLQTLPFAGAVYVTNTRTSKPSGHLRPRLEGLRGIVVGDVYSRKSPIPL